jgi:hypothetical protein
VRDRVICLRVSRSISVSWMGYFFRLGARVFMPSDQPVISTVVMH